MEDRKRILVADDDPDLLELLKMDLAFQGYEVVPATNGKEALDLASSQKVDLVLLDVMMPRRRLLRLPSSADGQERAQDVIMTSRDTARRARDDVRRGLGPAALRDEDLHERIKDILRNPSPKG